MKTDRPKTTEALIAIDDFEKAILEKFGNKFIQAIADVQMNKSLNSKPKERKISTFNTTLEMYKKGHSLQEIAELRSISIITVASHFTKLYSDGFDIDLNQFVENDDRKKVQNAKAYLKSPAAL